MRRHQRWLALALFLWGVPAFLAWLLLGFLRQLETARHDADQFAALEGRLLRLVTDSRPDRWFSRRLHDELERLHALAPDPTVVAHHLATREAAWPMNSVRLFGYDHRGRQLAAGPAPERAAIETLVTVLRHPVATAPELVDDLSPDQIARLETILPDPVEAVGCLRGAEASVRYLGRLRPPFPDFAFHAPPRPRSGASRYRPARFAAQRSTCAGGGDPRWASAAR